MAKSKGYIVNRQFFKTKDAIRQKIREILYAYPIGSRLGSSENLEEAIRFLPGVDQLPKAKAKSPAFIRNMITDFSRDLGDQDHIFSNISQATRIYRNCGLTEEVFMQALYEARALAKKATKVRHLNSHGNPNRMPYFFKCLSGALRPSAAECHS